MMRTAETFILVLILAVAVATPIHAETMTEQQLEDWFNDDGDMDVDMDRAVDDVNEGQLSFIAPPADKAVLATDAVVSMTEASLSTGLVSLQQCYRNLDPVPELDVVYSYRNMKQLRVVSSENIAQASVAGNSIQLQDLDEGASVCIAAEVQLLEKTSEQSYGLSFGPYYRRFLDGYYPYHVTITINYPEHLLDFSEVSPSPGPHFELIRKPDELTLDAWFEGVLQLDVRFSSTASD